MRFVHITFTYIPVFDSLASAANSPNEAIDKKEDLDAMMYHHCLGTQQCESIFFACIIPV